jgi:hypothetical protein
MVLDMKVNGLEFIKTAELTELYDKHHRRPSMMHSLVIIHPFQLPVGWELFRPHITYITCKQHLNSKAEYTNTQQGLPVQNKRLYL